DYITSKVASIREHLAEIDQKIDKNSNKWKIKRLGKSELAILRLAIFEIDYDDDIPDKVAINEAVELAKSYCDDNSSGFINGVLSGILGE
ncbi:MAG: transcription antitermination factor NusB, partial [Eubacterium sp.]|nr:transcription antitermination factor NusB [Eubacterium sp.]